MSSTITSTTVIAVKKEEKVSKEEASKPTLQKQSSLYIPADAELDANDWDDAAFEEEDQGTSSTMSMSASESKPPTLMRQVSYQIVEPERLAEQKESLIKQASELLFVTLEEASLLLRHYQWNSMKLREEWFKDQEKVRKTVGLSAKSNKESKVVDKTKKIQCQTAYCDEVTADLGSSLNCGHFFCDGCWTGYLNSQLTSGRSCIFATCMGIKCLLKHNHRAGCTCSELVPESIVRKYVKDSSLLAKYERWLLDSFVEGTKSIKWCPNPQCKRAVEYKSGGSKEIECRCGTHWCFSCTETAHSPCPCDLAKKWQKREKSEDATEIWLNARTKECPQCKVRIEKNRACNHMTCSKCGHQFCWLCKEPWSQHGSQTGGYYVCNKYNEEVQKKGNDFGANAEEKKMILQQRRLQKYEYFYKRYKSAGDGIKFTKAIGQRVEEKAQKDNMENSKYSFLTEAVDKLVQARRSIQWMHALIYYMKECSNKQLFEYQQELLIGETEALQDILESKTELDDLFGLRNDIVTRTRSMDKFRAEMIKIVEGGDLEDVILQEADLSNLTVWTCTNCRADNKKSAINCISCGACSKHGELECKACNRHS
eukprot:TRINITY_DN526_c0_g1_i1.p1 TRINITY_DN526_c0_g1~~TRINITY_DN526_c0_g1_i1.p1  ORF type:complete len:597 (-),score=160.21 TRINITY_DN526_c0_g1_i1:166-1956(-)